MPAAPGCPDLNRGWFVGGVQAPTGGVRDTGFGRERGLTGISNCLQINNAAIRL